MAATWRIYVHLTPSALWFFNGGTVLVISGLFNLVSRKAGANVRELRSLCRGVNVFVLAFSMVSGIVTGTGKP